jgi:hypothetical protein
MKAVVLPLQGAPRGHAASGATPGEHCASLGPPRVVAYVRLGSPACPEHVRDASPAEHVTTSGPASGRASASATAASTVCADPISPFMTSTAWASPGPSSSLEPPEDVVPSIVRASDEASSVGPDAAVPQAPTSIARTSGRQKGTPPRLPLERRARATKFWRTEDQCWSHLVDSRATRAAESPCGHLHVAATSKLARVRALGCAVRASRKTYNGKRHRACRPGRANAKLSKGVVAPTRGDVIGRYRACGIRSNRHRDDTRQSANLYSSRRTH